MSQILDIVVPVFCLIGLGYLVARSGYLGQTVGDGLADFVFRVAIPILLARSIATAQFAAGEGWSVWFGFWTAYFCGVLVVWVAAVLLVGKVFGRGHRAAMISGVAAGFANLVLMGIPLVQRAFGDAGLQNFLVLIAVHLPLMMVISTFGMEFAARADRADKTPINVQAIARSLARNLLLNPLIIGIFAGIIWRLTEVDIPGIAMQVTDLLAGTTGPLALVALGMGLTKYGIRGNLAPAFGLSLLSLIVLPGVIWVAGSTIFQLPPLWLSVAVLGAACPTGVNAYLFAIHFKTGEGLATNSIILSTLGSIITLPLWLSLIV